MRTHSDAGTDGVHERLETYAVRVPRARRPDPRALVRMDPVDLTIDSSSRFMTCAIDHAHSIPPGPERVGIAPPRAARVALVNPPSPGTLRASPPSSWRPGLGTRMKSRTPEAPPRAGRPADGRLRRRRRPRGHRSAPARRHAPRDRRRPRRARRRRRLRPPGRAARDGRRGRGRRRGAPRRRRRDPRPDRRRAAPGGRRCSSELLDERRLDEAAIALVAVDAIDPGQLGRVVRDDAGTVERIVERKDATDEEIAVNEINSGLYAFDAAWLRGRIGSLEPSPKTGELYLTELVELARADGRLVVALTVEDDGRLLGINDRAELAQAEWDLRTRINGEHMRAGVTMRDPSTVYLDAAVDARRGRDPRAERHPARRDVGRGGDDDRRGLARSSTARSAPAAWSGRAIVESSIVEDGATVGPFSHLRPGLASSGRTPRSATSPS